MQQPDQQPDQQPVAGARTFAVAGEAYDAFMGRYSTALAAPFADLAGLRRGQTALDVGCGPGALTGELGARLGADAVTAVDPSPPFVAACAARHPGVDVRLGQAERLPVEDHSVDAALAQLVLHFVTDPGQAALELRRVVRPGGVVAACVWDFAEGMQMLRHFWDAALTLDPDAPDEARTLRFGGPGEIADLFGGAGFTGVHETTLTVQSTYRGVEELWAGFLAGIGPAGAYCVSLDAGHQQALRAELIRRLGSPTGPVTLSATARAVRAHTPG